MLIRGAEIDGEIVDVRIEGGRIATVGPALPGEPSIDAGGGALLPGLHDHHIHLLALAAALDSVRCGPPEVHSPYELHRALVAARLRSGWIRGTGYHEFVAGELDRRALDALAPPGARVRIQHRSGALWCLSSAAVQALGLDAGADAEGVERDATGRATGRLFALDAWLRERLPADGPPGLTQVGRLLACRGVTGVTDATPANGTAELALLAEAHRSGALPQDVLVMGGPDLPEPREPGLARGAQKILLRERALPAPEALEAAIATAHVAGRPVAIHCVTRTELVLAAVALAAAGAREGDRIEHAAVAPPDLMALLAALPVTVVAQPNFVRERGDAYLREVEARDLPWLHRCRGFAAAGVPLGAGTDAPFGAPDPWLAMQAAVDRRSAGGTVLGPAESLSPERALALFTSPSHAPGGPPRQIVPGARADLCLLRVPWKQARDHLDSGDVVATVRGGAILPREREAG